MNEIGLPQSAQGSLWHLFPNLLFVAVIKRPQPEITWGERFLSSYNS